MNDIIKNKEDYLKEVYKINKWNIEYYTNSQPSVTDFVYDKHKKALEDYERETGEIHPNSPSQKVGGGFTNNFEKVRHDYPMLSIRNAKTEEDLNTFFNSTGNVEYTAEWKLDGIGVALRYENGKLVKALTRGDKTFGEDITNNVKEVVNIPKEIPYKEKIEFRGELHMFDASFKKHLDRAIALGEDKPANSRNLTSGFMKRKSNDGISTSGIIGTIYTIIFPEKHGMKTHQQSMEFIKSQGFRHNEILLIGNDKDITKLCFSSADRRDNLPYDADGIVIKVNDISLWNKIGLNNTEPKYFRAFKFAEKPSRSKILNIRNQVGKNNITPVADIEKVWVAGAFVSNVTLHNYEYIKENNINIGDEIDVVRSGEVIPKVHKVYKLTNDYYKAPTHCPSCGELLFKDSYVAIRCYNDDCREKTISQIESAVKKDCLNIEEIGERTIENMVDILKVKDFLDLYDLSLDDCKKVAGEANGVKIYNNIKESRKHDWFRFIKALDIDGVGNTYSKLLAVDVKTIDEFIENNFYVSNLSERVNNIIKTWIKDEKNLNRVKKVKSILAKYEVKNDYIYGKKIYGVNRPDIVEKIRNFGGEVVNDKALANIIVKETISVPDFLIKLNEIKKI